jgi:hypothetical protein
MPDIKKAAAPEVPVQEQRKYITEYRIEKPSRLILTTDKDFYDKSTKANGIPLFMVADSKRAEKICLSQSGLPLYLVQIPLDK